VNQLQDWGGPIVAKRITGWYIAAAVLFIALGIFGIVEPGVAGLGVTLLVGWLLIFGAVGHIIAAFRRHGSKHVTYQVLIAIVYLIGGLYFLTHMLMATATLTLLLAGVILVEGVLEITSYFRMKGEGAAGWLLLNGIMTLLLGGLIWFHWPSSSVWAIGTLVGVNLLVTGFSRLMFGLAVRKLMNNAVV
jgi:uncharacterized membrane protein HdeD (DUF308 family)